MRGSLSVIIPAYDEENRLPLTLEAVKEYFGVNNLAYEIIVVNDGSRDNTSAVVRRMAGKIKNLRLIDNKKNSGKGFAVKQGILAARMEYSVYIDADNAVSIDQINNLWPYFHKGYDIIIGSIEVAGAKTGRPSAFYRHFLGKASKYIIRAAVLPEIRDSQRAFKLFPTNVAKKIFSGQTISGWGFDIEILVIARALGYRIKEVPVTWLNSGDSKVKFFDYFRTWQELMKIRRNIKEKRY